MNGGDEGTNHILRDIRDNGKQSADALHVLVDNVAVLQATLSTLSANQTSFAEDNAKRWEEAGKIINMVAPVLFEIRDLLTQIREAIQPSQDISAKSVKLELGVEAGQDKA